jgi:hypothetical protein
MTAPDTARAFAAAEAAYLEPPLLDAEAVNAEASWPCWEDCPDCGNGDECGTCQACEWQNDTEPDWETLAEMREEMREERWSRD